MVINGDLPSGKHTTNYGESPCFLGNLLFLSPFSIVFCMFTGGYEGGVGYTTILCQVQIQGTFDRFSTDRSVALLVSATSMRSAFL